MNFNMDMSATLILWSIVPLMLWINDKRQNKGRANHCIRDDRTMNYFMMKIKFYFNDISLFFCS